MFAVKYELHQYALCRRKTAFKMLNNERYPAWKEMENMCRIGKILGDDRYLFKFNLPGESGENNENFGRHSDNRAKTTLPSKQRSRVIHPFVRQLISFFCPSFFRYPQILHFPFFLLMFFPLLFFHIKDLYSLRCVIWYPLGEVQCSLCNKMGAYSYNDSN
jgi:hypothetical protein